MTIKNILGDYTIIGTNQNDSDETYKGTLSLTLDENNSIIAKWLINKSQEQFGVGFFKDNILVINFKYMGDENDMYYGTVVYKCFTKDILEGFWSEEFGNPQFLGSENCFRVKNKKDLPS
ncbi:hypothetical protein [Polaribacter sp. Hel_I_88]|uniref:hypothetical protein n=1 Tax=Polaribacter sp. Hel_I_88 TaxID=1250006 RepID=UPI000479D790|nr:hypothetical protein [Polaribacter sp. Hel_I_88]